MDRRDDLTAIVLAAGRGERLGSDKATIDLGGKPAIQRALDTLRSSGVRDIVVVRRLGAPTLPQLDGARVVEGPTEAMLDTLRLARRSAPSPRVLVFPIDHAMVARDTVNALLAAEAPIVLPCCRDRVGHPIVLAQEVLAEIDAPGVSSLRDVIRRDPSRVTTVGVDDGWIFRDLDTPADLAAARGQLTNMVPATVLMGRHRSRRGYAPDPVGDEQLRWIVDSARFASTSSFIQAYAVVAVRDAERRDRIAHLCAEQDHIRQAPVFLAVCADLSKIDAACARHGKSLAAGSLEVFLEATIDATILGQNIQLAAESEGLGACMIGAARDHPIELARELQLPRACYVVFGMTLGWPTDDPLPRGRMPLSAVLHDETFDASRIAPALDAADDAMRAWAKRTNARTAGTGARAVREDRGWTDRMAFLFGGASPHAAREELGRQLRALGFGLDADPT